MPFKVVVKGRDDESGYDLSYGKGKNKLVAFAVKQPNGRFLCTEIGVNDPVMLRLIKESFAVWAADNYQGEGEPVVPVSRPPTFRPPTKPAPVTPTTSTAELIEGERDPILDGEAAFFATLSTLRRKLTDPEARTLRDLANYLTGYHMPVKTEATTGPVPQLGKLLDEGTPEEIQNLINEGPTRDDQIKRWYAAYSRTGVEFAMPQTTEIADARDDDSAAPERPAAAELPAPSGPPPFRPAVGKAAGGPPRYNKPPAAQG